MRLTTARAAEGRTHLYVLGSSGWIAVAEAARALGLTKLDDVEDVGSLYRTGEAAVDLVRRIAADPRSADQPARTLADLTLAPVVTHPGSIVCVGRNYLEHIHEGSGVRSCRSRPRLTSGGLGDSSPGPAGRLWSSSVSGVRERY